MRLVQRANACFSLFYKGKHILMDPWMNGPSVAQGWTPYPPAKSRMQDLQKPDLVYISHIHSDHCDVFNFSTVTTVTFLISLE